jgi:hypothetical protein
MRVRIVVPTLAVLLAGVVVAWLFWPSSTTAVVGSEANVGPYVVRLDTDSVSTGVADLTFDITDDSNQPAAPELVSVEPVMTQMGHPLSPVRAIPGGPGKYRARVNFEMVGQWEITVRITSDHKANDAVLPLTVVG